jgi:glucan phosphoethanolaminetransferase (alkaline phosphatase superfamily)
LYFFITPFFTFAKEKIRSIDSTNATNFVTTVAEFINQWVIPIMVLLALAYFLFGVVTYIGERDDSKIEEKKQKMFWGLIALFIMLSVWSLVYVISDTFNIDTRSNNSSFYETWGDN